MTTFPLDDFPARDTAPYSDILQAIIQKQFDAVGATFDALPGLTGQVLLATNALAELLALGLVAQAQTNLDVYSRSDTNLLVALATSGPTGLDPSAAFPAVRIPPSPRMGLPMRAFRLAIGNRATTPVIECVIGDSLSQLLVTDPENTIWDALYEAAMCEAYNPSPRSAGYMQVDVPAGFPYPQGVHWDTLTTPVKQTSVPYPAIVGTGVISTNLSLNTFNLVLPGAGTKIFENDTPIMFSGISLTTGTGLANLVPLYVVNSVANGGTNTNSHFQVSTTVGGSPIDLGGGVDSAITAMSLGAPWGCSLTNGQFCEVTRNGDAVTIFYSAQHVRGDTATVLINNTPVGTINSTDASVPASPGFDSGRSATFISPVSYGPMTVRVTDTSGSGTFLLDACYIHAGNATSGYRLDNIAHGGWGMVDLLDSMHPATLQHIKNQLPQLVTIHLGANDTKNHSITVDQFTSLLTSTFAAVRAQYGSNNLPSLRFIFEPEIDAGVLGQLGTVAPTNWSTDYRAAAREVCEDDGDVTFIDWYEALGAYGAGDDPYGIAPDDTIHPLEAGHYVFAQALIDATIVGSGGSGFSVSRNGDTMLGLLTFAFPGDAGYRIRLGPGIGGAPFIQMSDGSTDGSKVGTFARLNDTTWQIGGTDLTTLITPSIAVAGVTGASANVRLAGGVVSAHPSVGTWLQGDMVISQNGQLFICTVGGTPGTWAQIPNLAGIASAFASLGGANFVGSVTVPSVFLTGLPGSDGGGGRLVGVTETGPPSGGRIAQAGDLSWSQDGEAYICTTGGDPGTWATLPNAGDVTAIAQAVVNQFAVYTVDDDPGIAYSNSVTETSLFSATHDIPANSLAVGDLIEVVAFGSYLQNSGAGRDVTFNAYFDAVKVALVISSFGGNAVPANAAARPWMYTAKIRIASIGATGTCNSVASLTLGAPAGQGDILLEGLAPLAATIDTTQALTVDLKSVLSAATATQTMTCLGITVRKTPH